MPWYYAGPEAKPVGPVSAEQLHALRAAGMITPETFVIEHTGAGAANLAWKRYSELFPATPAIPPVPSAPPAPPAPQPAAIPTTPPAAPHPLFPSAAPVPGAHPLFPSSGHPGAYPPIKPTNGWCAWGFGLSLVGFCFAFARGIGFLPALIGLLLCIVGLVQVSKNREQGGQGLAIGGLIFSTIGLLVAIIFLALLGGPILKAHGLTVTEQTSNDSE